MIRRRVVRIFVIGWLFIVLTCQSYGKSLALFVCCVNFELVMRTVRPVIRPHWRQKKRILLERRRAPWKLDHSLRTFGLQSAVRARTVEARVRSDPRKFSHLSELKPHSGGRRRERGGAKATKLRTHLRRLSKQLLLSTGQTLAGLSDSDARPTLFGAGPRTNHSRKTDQAQDDDFRWTQAEHKVEIVRLATNASTVQVRAKLTLIVSN